MNEIHLRTNKGEYSPGQDVFGVIYLNIARPTSGRGVKLKFEGFEHIFYHSVIDNEEYHFEDNKHYIDCTDVTLYISDDVLQMGSYCFPFKVKLLADIPGSFASQGGTDASWVAKVTYWLKAELIDAEDLCTTQHLVVHHPLPSGILPNDAPLAVTSKIEVSHRLLFKKRVFITAKLTKQVWQSGDVAKLRIIVTNEAGVDVSSIKMKLFRELILMKRSMAKLCLDPRVTEDEEEQRIYIRPEGTEPYLVWESTIAGCSQEILNKGLDNIHIPLRNGYPLPMPSSVNSSHIKENSSCKADMLCKLAIEAVGLGVEEVWIPLKHSDGTPLLTSVLGYHIQCFYYIDIEVTLVNQSSTSLSVPVYILVHPEDEEWHKWKPPEWVFTSQVVTGNSQFSVPENLLKSEVFSGIPRFQTLSPVD